MCLELRYNYVPQPHVHIKAPTWSFCVMHSRRESRASWLRSKHAINFRPQNDFGAIAIWKHGGKGKRRRGSDERRDPGGSWLSTCECGSQSKFSVFILPTKLTTGDSAIAPCYFCTHLVTGLIKKDKVWMRLIGLVQNHIKICKYKASFAPPTWSLIYQFCAKENLLRLDRKK